MASNIEMPLTNSRGLGKIVFFKGLKFPMAITPSLLGEPILTAQAHYFVDRLDSVVRVRFKSHEDVPSERDIEYIIDNYLFEYSKRHPDDKLTSKITEFSYWREDPDNHYFQYDWRNVECLVLDTLNDPSIIECRDRFHGAKDDWYDWCLFKTYFQEIFDDYRKKLNAAAKFEVYVKTDDHPTLGTGEHNLPILKLVYQPLTLEQVEMFEVVYPDKLKAGSDTYLVSRGMDSQFNFEFPQEIVDASSYHDAQLLAHYFSAVRDYSPVSQFKNYYNVLEYFFEEAPAKLGVSAQSERQQIEAVLRWATSSGDLLHKVKALPPRVIAAVTNGRKTSSGEVIAGVNLTASDFAKEYAGHVYQMRNACVHSKKTRKGKATPRIIPSTEEEGILADEMPVVQWLAVKCIEKDSSPSP